MNRQRIRVIVLAVLLVAAGAYVWAQRSASTVKPAPTANTAVKKPATAAQPTKPTAPPITRSATAATPAPAAGKPTIPTALPAPRTTAPVAAAAGKPAPVTAASNVAATPAPPVAAAATPAPAVVVPAVATAPWQDKLQKGAYLSEKLRPRLPENTDLLAASAGFRDLQQFVATVNAAHNLNLSFEELKRRVVTDRKGLASAIDGMKKVASATIEEQRAEYDARGLIQEANRQPAPPPPPPVTKAATKPQPKKPFRAQSGS